MEHTTGDVSGVDRIRTRGDELRELGEKEQQLLALLISKKGRVVPRVELARAVGLRDSERRVDVHLVHVRKLLGDDGLRNVRGRGWMIPADFDTSMFQAA
jgi:DNA-binding response OmpR family regulator